MILPPINSIPSLHFPPRHSFSSTPLALESAERPLAAPLIYHKTSSLPSNHPARRSTPLSEHSNSFPPFPLISLVPSSHQNRWFNNGTTRAGNFWLTCTATEFSRGIDGAEDGQQVVELLPTTAS